MTTIAYRTIELSQEFIQFSREILEITGAVVPIVIVVGGVMVVWGLFELWSAAQERRLREAQKPINIDVERR